jgi:hypothetical protein
VTVRTWHLELAFAAVVLAGVALATGGWLQWVAALAVLGTFAHVQIGDRLQEREAARDRPMVECHRQLARYLVAKEVLWVAFFALSGAWTALAGVPLFLLYPLWRRWWRSRHPLEAQS